MAAQEDNQTDPGNESGRVKRERTVVVQERQDIVSEPEDGQDHDDAGDDTAAPQSENEENDGIHWDML